MALTLPPALLAAQTNKSRRPIVEMTAGRLAADFPFIGNAIANPDDEQQGVSKSLFLPDGRLVVLYVGQYDDYPFDEPLKQLRMLVTDAAVTEFSDYVAVYSDGLRQITYLDAIAIDTATIGVVAKLATDRLGLFTVSDAGVKLSEVQLTSLATLQGAAIVATDSGYGLVYIQESGGSYSIYLRTSTDFVNWSAASTITISGLDASHPVQHPRLERLADGSYLLSYSYVTASGVDNDIYNLQYSTSTDLSTWAASTPITDTSAINTDFTDLDLVQKSDGSLFIAAQRSSTYLEMTTSALGWGTTEDIGPTNVWVDSAAGKIYLTSINAGIGTKDFNGMARIDTDTWSIERFYGENTVPAIPAPLVAAGTDCFKPAQNLGTGSVATLHGSSVQCVAVVDYDADTIRAFCLEDLSSYGETYTKNVDTDAVAAFFGLYADYAGLYYSAVVDNTLWLVFIYGATSWAKYCLASIDMSQSSAPYDMAVVSSVTVSRSNGYDQFFSVLPESGLALFATTNLVSRVGGLTVVSLDGGGVVADYDINSHVEFPHCGVVWATVIGDTLWAVPNYEANYAPESDHYKWGLMEINLNTGSISYHYPGWLNTAGVYLGLADIDEAATELFFRTTNGCAVFNYSTKTFEQLENTVIDGLPPTDLAPYSWAGGIAYDATRELLVYGSMNHVYLVPRTGTIDTIDYITDAGDFVFNAPLTMVGNYVSGSPSLAIDGDDVVYATWTDRSGVPTVQWDSTAARIDLGAYLQGEVVAEWQLNQPSSLSFQVKDGHLFDQQNDNSLLRDKLAKGKGVELRFGETVGGVDYTVPQGTFSVASTEVSYRKGEYPLMRVTCDTPQAMWGDHQVTAVDIHEKTPEEAIALIAENHTSFTADTIDIPAMPLSFSFSSSWLDSPLGDIFTSIAARFQHFLTIDHNNKLVARPIDFAADSVNYHAKGQLTGFTLDNRKSDYANKITITGAALDDFQVEYAEERLVSMSGTVGWWGYKNDFTIYYSDDKQKMAKNPRLEVIETATSIGFKLAGSITETITEVDPYHRFCVVTVQAPSLVPLLVSGIGLYLVGNGVGDAVITYLFGGWTEPVGRVLESVGLLLITNVLASVGNYQYAIHGNPIGYASHSYSASATNDALIQEWGQEVENKYEGFLCHSQAHCQQVAKFELSFADAKRKPLTATHPAHLADEIGDIVTVEHMYTGIPKKIFVHGLTRSYKPATASDKNGYFLDELRGWVI